MGYAQLKRWSRVAPGGAPAAGGAGESPAAARIPQPDGDGPACASDPAAEHEDAGREHIGDAGGGSGLARAT
ncbi:hypothetical protein CF642_37875, partial [Burkholderia pseudomallei]